MTKKQFSVCSFRGKEIVLKTSCAGEFSSGTENNADAQVFSQTHWISLREVNASASLSS